jgi:hypothetical protein
MKPVDHYKGLLAIKYIAFSTAVIFLVRSGIAAGLDHWTWRNPLPSGNNLLSVAYGSGTFVAVGGTGAMQLSSDGSAWTVLSRVTTRNLNRVIYANGLFLMLGDGGLIMTSADGLTWQARVSGVTNNLLAAAYGNSKFLAVGAAGTTVVSTDAIQWTPVSSGVTNDFNWVTFGNGTFVLPTAPPEGPTWSWPKDSVLVSTNGVQWSAKMLQTTRGSSVAQVAFGNGEFQAHVYEDDGTLNVLTGYFYHSTNAIDWSVGPSDCAVWPAPCHYSSSYPVKHRVLAFLNSGFLAIQDVVVIDSTAVNKSFVAVTAGGSWSSTNLSKSYPIMDAAYGAGKYVLVGTAGLLMTSPDGTNWTVGLEPQPRITQVAAGNGVYVAVGGAVPWLPTVVDRIITSDASPILVSSNGLAFYPALASTQALASVAYGKGAFVAVGKAGTLQRSTNGVVWQAGTSSTTLDLASICYGTNLWVAVGGNGTVITSPTGLAWTSRNSGTGYTLYGITFGYGLYVAVGAFGAVVTSPDGMNWTVQYSGVTNHLFKAAAGNGMFVVSGDDGTMLTSSDGVNWTPRSFGTDSSLYSLSFGQGQFVVVGIPNEFVQFITRGNILFQSYDGATWQEFTPNLSAPGGLFGAAFIADSFWICGEYGTLWQSDVLAAQPFLTGKMLANSSGFELTVRRMEGKNYRIQSSGSLQPQSWSDQVSVINSQSEQVWTDTNVISAKFYRVISP